MSDSPKIIHSILGGKRGIDFQLVKKLSATKDNVVVTSARRYLSIPKNKQLQDFSRDRDNVHLVQLDVTEPEIINNVVHEIKNPSFEGIDIVIESLEFSDFFYEVLEAPKEA